jgi:hypothetical protein
MMSYFVCHFLALNSTDASTDATIVSIEKGGQTTFGDVAEPLSVAIGMKKEKLLFRMSAFGSDNHETDEQ